MLWVQRYTTYSKVAASVMGREATHPLRLRENKSPRAQPCALKVEEAVEVYTPSVTSFSQDSHTLMVMGLD